VLVSVLNGITSRVAVLVTATAVAVGSLTSAGAAVEAVRSAPSPGAPGIGDPYFPTDGNGGYDVRHYAVDVRYAVATGDLTGTTTVSARATQDLSRFNLDLVLDATAVRVDGLPVPFTSGGHELVVRPGTPIRTGTRFTVSVDYQGRPAEVSHRGNRPWVSSSAEAMATNEPQIAPWWFPANDHPRDKATFDISVSVPTGQQAISNGTFLGTTSQPGWDTWRWQADEPMAPYLAFFAAGSFEYESGVHRGLPYFNAVSTGLQPGNRSRALRLMRRSPAIVRWLETQLGDYPFSSTGGVTTSLSAGFALENQTRPTYPFLGNGRFARSIVVHELAHQWFGDHVAVDRWRDIWLNEGFASWFEWRYDEAHGGRSARATLLSRYNAYAAGDATWRLRIGDPGPDNLFDLAVYDRGAMTVQALRNRIGNADFKKLLRAWVSERGEGNGRVGQFERLAERVSGERLDGFFDAWLFTGRKPARTEANGLR
jgi:aminopeptidase N